MNCMYGVMQMTFGNLASTCTIDDQIHTGTVTLVRAALEISDDNMMVYNSPDFYNQCSKFWQFRSFVIIGI